MCWWRDIREESAVEKTGRKCLGERLRGSEVGGRRGGGWVVMEVLRNRDDSIQEMDRKTERKMITNHHVRGRETFSSIECCINVSLMSLD